VHPPGHLSGKKERYSVVEEMGAGVVHTKDHIMQRVRKKTQLQKGQDGNFRLPRKRKSITQITGGNESHWEESRIWQERKRHTRT